MIGFFNDKTEFHEQRKRTVGSSDIPVLVGLTAKWDQTPYTLWREKTGRDPGFEGNDATFWGNMHERNILYKYLMDRYGEDLATEWQAQTINGINTTIGGSLKKSGFEVELHTSTFARHDEYEYAIAHADLFLPNIDHIQEAKSAKFYAAKRRDDLDYGYSGDDNSINGIPLAVYVQLQWQMFCYGAKTGGVSALIDTSDYREYGPCEPDVKTQEKLLALADRFMWHVRNDKEPKPETWKDVEQMFPRVEETAKIVDPSFQISETKTLYDMLLQRQALERKSKEIQERLDDIKKAVGLLMTDNKVLQSPDGTIYATASMQSRRSIPVTEVEKDAELFAKLNAAGLIKTSEFKKITFKKIKE